MYNRLETVQETVRRFSVIPFHRMISARIPTTINHGSKNQLPIISKCSASRCPESRWSASRSKENGRNASRKDSAGNSF